MTVETGTRATLHVKEVMGAIVATEAAAINEKTGEITDAMQAASKVATGALQKATTTTERAAAVKRTIDAIQSGGRVSA